MRTPLIRIITVPICAIISFLLTSDPQSVGTEGAIPISALHGTGLDEMMTSVERAVLSATRRKFWRIILPSDGPELRLAPYILALFPGSPSFCAVRQEHIKQIGVRACNSVCAARVV